MTNTERFKALISKEKTDTIKRMKFRRKYRRIINLINWLKLKYIVYKKG